MKGRLKQIYLDRLAQGRPVPMGPDERVLVFAPHPDDETLGCGGTIAMHRQHGSEVRVVIVTDGRASHRRFMDEQALSEVRATEVHKALETLGVRPDAIRLLGYPDSAFAPHAADVLEDARTAIARFSPTQVYLPSRYEQPADHHQTFSIVAEALGTCRQRLLGFEYPVWFWMQWPFAPLKRRQRRFALPLAMGRTLRDNLRLLGQFRDCCDIRPVLDRKRAALGCHASQMTRLNGERTWPVLADVADGAFLDALTQPFEIFQRVRW